jgi:hypothetical protein
MAFSFLVHPFALSGSDAQTTNIVAKFKHSEVGKVFLRDHSEKNLETVVAFLQDPMRNFRRVQGVADVCSYIYAYANYLTETKEKDEAGYHDLGIKYFRVATDKNVPILTYLVMNCHNAFLEESFVDEYTMLFGATPEVFVRDLRRRPNWRQVVDQVRGGYWGAFKDGLAKLGNSEFERQLKDYALSISN